MESELLLKVGGERREESTTFVAVVTVLVGVVCLCSGFLLLQVPLSLSLSPLLVSSACLSALPSEKLQRGTLSLSGIIIEAISVK